jgi:hypothetical protein
MTISSDTFQVCKILTISSDNISDMQKKVAWMMIWAVMWIAFREKVIHGY